MAHLKKVRRASGQEWIVVYSAHGPDGAKYKTNTHSYKRERDAAKERARIELEVEGKVRIPKRQQPTVRQAFEASIGLEDGQGRGNISRGRRVGPKKLSDRSVANVHILPRLGARKLDEVTPHTVRAFFDSLDRAGVGKRQQSVRALLHALFQEAVKDGSVPSNPVSGIVLPPIDERDPRFLAVKELDGLVGAMPTHRDAVLTQFLGLRRAIRRGRRPEGA